ncbi:MAG: hypothetical protein JXD23_15095 [Spirochaetales bacterium]|nr:hypothetical protein [Spirochaetales bacterium]
MSVKCEIRLSDSDQGLEAELEFVVFANAAPHVIYNNQIGFLENPKGARVYHEQQCKTLWFVIRRTM